MNPDKHITTKHPIKKRESLGILWIPQLENTFASYSTSSKAQTANQSLCLEHKMIGHDRSSISPKNILKKEEKTQ